MQTEPHAAPHRLEPLPLALPRRRPVAVPYATLREAGACYPRASAVQALRVDEMPAADIRERQVRQVHIVSAPGRAVVGWPAARALAEENQLEAEPIALNGPHVAGVVPPLGLEIGMFEMIARKLVAITGQRFTIGGVRGRQQTRQKGE